MIADTAFPRDDLDPARTTGLILCGMGGPDGPEAVEPFLRNLFQDPQIFPVPRLLAPLIGRLIAWRRAPEVRERYAMISQDSATPQLPTTIRQAGILAGLMTERGMPTLAGVAMRYWDPFPDESVKHLLKEGAEQFVIVPTYPQYSGATNGSTIQFVLESLRAQAPDAAVHVVSEWGTEKGFVNSLARSAQLPLIDWADQGVDPAECALVYVAHSLPQSFIDKGDPYLERTLATIAAVHGQVRYALKSKGHEGWFDTLNTGGTKPLLTFQSKVGPIAWLGPQIEDEVPQMAAAGCRRLMVQPVSFTCEHIETLLELDIELADTAHTAGITDFQRGAALNLDDRWLDSMAAHLVNAALAPESERRVPDA